MRLQMIVFDVAGTVVNDDDNAVAGKLCDALQAVGTKVTETQVNPVMGLPKPQAVRELLNLSRGSQPDEAEVMQVHADFQQRIIEHYRNAPTIRPKNGAEELFAQLRNRGTRVTLDTGFDRATLDTILERLHWRDLIDDSVTSDEVDHGRPAADMIRVLMSRAGITDPSLVGKVGDSVSDIQEGLTAKCGLVVAVLCERTIPALPDYPGVSGIERLSELIPIIDGFKSPKV